MNLASVILMLQLALILLSSPNMTQDQKAQALNFANKAITIASESFIVQSPPIEPIISQNIGTPALAPITPVVPIMVPIQEATTTIIEVYPGTCVISAYKNGTIDAISWTANNGSDLTKGSLFAIDKNGGLTYAGTPYPYVGKTGNLGLDSHGTIGYKLTYTDGTKCQTNVQ